MKTLLLIFLATISLIDSCEKKKDEVTEAQEPKFIKRSTSKKAHDDSFFKKTDRFLRDKEISETTKGAVIGGAAGAVAGAVISKKNPEKGALVGGLIGAGAGTVTGKAVKNKRERGRVFKNGLFGRRRNKD